MRDEIYVFRKPLSREAGAAQRDYNSQWYEKWKRWRDFFSSGLGWAAPHSAALPFMACQIGLLWDATDLPSEKRAIRIVPTVPAVHTVGFPRWEVVRYEVPARGKLPPMTFTWHRGASHFIEKALGGCRPTGGRSTTAPGLPRRADRFRPP